MNWNDLRFAAAVARHGGLSGAARALRSSPQTVGRRVAALEAALGVSLFVRHPGGYRLTPDGEALLAEVEEVEAAVAGFQARAAGLGGDVSGLVRIAAPETITERLLVPSLRALLERHPGLHLELTSAVALVGMARGEADIALRLVRPKAGALTVRQVGTMGQAFYAADAGIALGDARLVGWPTTTDLPATRWLRRVTGREPDIRLNHLATQEAAIRSGIGIGVLPHFLAAGLKKVDAPEPPAEPLWLIAQSGATSPSRIRIAYEEVAHIVLQAGPILNPQ